MKLNKIKIDKIPIRTELVLLNSLAFGLVTLFMFIFIPKRVENYSLEIMNERAKSIISLISAGVQPALYFNDKIEGRNVLNNAKNIPDISYIVVNNVKGEQFVSYNFKNAEGYNFLDISEKNPPFSEDVIKLDQPLIEGKREIGKIYLGLSLNMVHAELQKARIVIAVFCTVLFLIFFVGTYGISTIVMAPLTGIVDTIKKITRGERKLRAGTSFQKEVSVLANSFNQMLDNLDSAYEDLQKSNDQLETRVIERTRDLSMVNESLQNEVSVRKKAEQTTRMLYDIAKAQGTTGTLSELVETIISILRPFLKEREFIIALYNEIKNEITLTCFTNGAIKNKSIQNVSQNNSPIAEILFQGKIITIHKEQIMSTLNVQPSDEFSGALHESIGFPLKLKEKTIGAFIIEVFGRELIDDVENKDILELLIEQITIVINNKKIEERIRLLAQAIESTSELVSITDNNNNLIYANNAFYNTYGFYEERIIGSRIETVRTSPDSFELSKEIINATLNGGWQGELTNRRKDGSEFPIFLTTSPVLNSNGDPVAMIGVATDMTDIKYTLKVLEESEEKFKHLFNNAPLPMYVRSLNNSMFIEVNDAMINYYGYSKQEFLGMNLIDIFVNMDVAENIEHIKSYNSDQMYFGQAKHKLKNGSIIDVEITAHAINYSGKPAVLAAIVDITSRLKAQTLIQASLLEKETLLKEIHHRVKNNLQVISSLLNLQSKKIKDEYDLALFNESRDRVKSMAMIHEMLYRSKDLAGIDFSEYLKKLMSSLMQSYNLKRNVGFKMDVKGVYLTIDTAVPCGLIINELVTNSLKYAFPGSTSGYIIIKVEQKDKLVISVEDNGIGLKTDINFDNIDSLGLRLVKILVDQLHGTMEVIRDEGTKFVLTLN
jgi:PAS domain S-box-containing protein